MANGDARFGPTQSQEHILFLLLQNFQFGGNLNDSNTMAFDMPIEADRVDDLGLFSFFIRAPIVGTIMWILGGDEAKKQEEKEKQTNDEVVSQEHSVLAPAQLQKMIESNQQKRKGGLKKAPRLVGSDISDFGDCAIQLNAADMEHHFSRSALEDEYDLAKSNKKMSWSDESGQDLVQYIGDDVSVSFYFLVFSLKHWIGSRSKAMTMGFFLLFSSSAQSSPLGRGCNLPSSPGLKMLALVTHISSFGSFSHHFFQAFRCIIDGCELSEEGGQ